ncbi:MAG: 1-phosphofructokinase [Brevibacillus sp.]|nr:1-phosphofructokinase [Brevibacillus sp.]
MIATVTLNPSVDISYFIDEFNINAVNRCDRCIKNAGGKGINVTKVLRALGCEVVATGFLGGETGQLIERELKNMSVITDFVQIEGHTRNCIAILANGTQTEILESGPRITKEESETFIQKLTGLMDKCPIRVVAASGSLPPGLEPDYYARIIREAKRRNIKFVLDTSGDFLKEALAASPYLIKPNVTEIEDLLKTKIHSERELISALQELQTYGMEMIVVSLGKDGCIAFCKDHIYKVSVPRVYAINPVGSGDAMVAGMVKEIHNHSSFEKILKVGTTCGILNAIQEKTGWVEVRRFYEFYEQIRIEKIA